MTIREAASIAGVSPQAIYKRLKASDKPVDKLKTKDGTLTTEGLQLLSTMFPALRDTMPTDEAAELRSQITALQEQVKLLTDEAAALRDSLQQEKARAAELAVKVELLTAERDHLRQVLDHEQALHAALLQKMPVLPADTKKSRHWWERLRK